MLRIHLMQNRYCLGDEATEDALIEVESMRRFAHLDFAQGSIPDASTILRSATFWRNTTYTNLHKLEAMCPRACAEGSDGFGLGGKLVPGQGAVVEDVLIAGEDPIGEPVVP